ncbi:hypothetical protein SEPCBS119000_004723 [Sporothrix epigloea]|uniref:Protein-ER retention receptor n=1 Tax=Sporothrix epigloea TaxID=1892477 RepID=A0ABP0DXG1_9PEZI
MTTWNIFRITGDCLHLLSKCILIFSIHRNRSAEGVSLITQVLYAIVFCSRYINVFSETSAWNLFFKIFYITTSFYIIVVMRWVFPRSRELELAWKMGAGILIGSLLLSPFGMLIFISKYIWSFTMWLWSFSEILESVAVLPQLLLLRQTSVPTVIDSFYLLALGSYRGFYILNWIERAADPNDSNPNVLSTIFGIIQTLLYLDFAWVYWTRQRVKLRGGGVVDADDIRQGWLLRRIFGKHVDRMQDGTDDEESEPALHGDGRRYAGFGARGGGRGGAASVSKNTWGARGISVSADDTTHEHVRLFGPERSDSRQNLDASVDPDAQMQDPDELAAALSDEDENEHSDSSAGDDSEDEDEDDEDDEDEDEDEDEDGAPPPAQKKHTGVNVGGVRNDEWDD